MSKIRGSFTALATPYTSDSSELDYSSLERLLRFQLDSNINGLVIGGASGEIASLTQIEYKNFLDFVLRYTEHKIPVVAGITEISTHRAVELANVLKPFALDALMVTCPPFNKPTQTGIQRHFEEISKASRTPLIAYNAPSRSGLTISPDCLFQMFSREIIIGVKDATNNINSVLECRRLCGSEFTILAGEDALIHATMACGGCGVISVVSNLAPIETLAITNAALKQDWKLSLESQLKLLPLIKALFIESNPIPLKAALALKGLISSPSLRLPLVSASSETVESLKALLNLK